MQQDIVAVLALVAVLGIGAQWLAWRARIPAIVLLTAIGLLVGPGLGWVQPARDLGEFFTVIIELSVAIILLEGGLSLRIGEFRRAGVGNVLRLVTLGMLISFALGGLAARYVGGLSWPISLMFAAIAVITGPTVIVPLLRQARLRLRPASYLKWEGVINDPVGAMLAVFVFHYLVFVGPKSVPLVASQFVLGIAFAVALGVATGFALGALFRHDSVPEYLKGPSTLVAAIAVYAIADPMLEASGLVAATILGITLGNMHLPDVDELRRFKEYVVILLVSSIFILLTANIDPATLLRLDSNSAALLLAMLFLVRPLSVLLATLGAAINRNERLFLAWVAPRGIVSAALAGVFAPRLQAHGYAGAELLLPLVFALIVITVIVHGFTANWLGRMLGLTVREQNGALIVGASSWTIGLAQRLRDSHVPVTIADASWRRLRRARLAGIPTYYGEILSEATASEFEVSEIGHLLAATDNDAYNALVCNHFAPELGRNHVFQLPYLAPQNPKRISPTVRGLMAPVEDAWFEELLRHWYQGWTFHKTTLTTSFHYDNARAAWPKGSIPIATVQKAGVQFHSPEQPIHPRPGDTVLWFGPKEGEARPTEVAPCEVVDAVVETMGTERLPKEPC